MSDEQGNYRFTDIDTGWYNFSFNWKLNQKPDVALPLERRNGFLLAYYESKEGPKEYFALALEVSFVLQKHCHFEYRSE